MGSFGLLWTPSDSSGSFGWWCCVASASPQAGRFRRSTFHPFHIYQVALGAAAEGAGQGVTGNSLWPATVIESQAGGGPCLAQADTTFLSTLSTNSPRRSPGHGTLTILVRISMPCQPRTSSSGTPLPGERCGWTSDVLRTGWPSDAPCMFVGTRFREALFLLLFLPVLFKPPHPLPRPPTSSPFCLPTLRPGLTAWGLKENHPLRHTPPPLHLGSKLFP